MGQEEQTEEPSSGWAGRGQGGAAGVCRERRQIRGGAGGRTALAGPHEAALALEGLCHHVVDQPVLVPAFPTSASHSLPAAHATCTPVPLLSNDAFSRSHRNIGQPAEPPVLQNLSLLIVVVYELLSQHRNASCAQRLCVWTHGCVCGGRRGTAGGTRQMPSSSNLDLYLAS